MRVDWKMVGLCVSLLGSGVIHPATVVAETIHVPSDFDEIYLAVEDEATADGDTILVTNSGDYLGFNSGLTLYIIASPNQTPTITSSVIMREGLLRGFKVKDDFPVWASATYGETVRIEQCHLEGSLGSTSWGVNTATYGTVIITDTVIDSVEYALWLGGFGAE